MSQSGLAALFFGAADALDEAAGADAEEEVAGAGAEEEAAALASADPPDTRAEEAPRSALQSQTVSPAPTRFSNIARQPACDLCKPCLQPKVRTHRSFPFDLCLRNHKKHPKENERQHAGDKSDGVMGDALLRYFYFPPSLCAR